MESPWRVYGKVLAIFKTPCYGHGHGSPLSLPDGMLIYICSSLTEFCGIA